MSMASVEEASPLSRKMLKLESGHPSDTGSSHPRVTVVFEVYILKGFPFPDGLTQA